MLYQAPQYPWVSSCYLWLKAEELHEQSPTFYRIFYTHFEKAIEHPCDQIATFSKIVENSFITVLSRVAWISVNHNISPFPSKIPFLFSSQAEYLIFIFIIYKIIYKLFFKSPRICLHHNQNQKSCIVYFVDSCKANSIITCIYSNRMS